MQVPLYLVDNVEALGATRLLMGVPLYALVLVFSWLVVRAVYPSSSRSGGVIELSRRQDKSGTTTVPGGATLR